MEDASSWDRWVILFEDASYMGAPGWPGDPETVATQRRPAQPRELEPRGPTQLRAVPLQLANEVGEDEVKEQYPCSTRNE